jgi:hypothetical protein
MQLMKAYDKDNIKESDYTLLQRLHGSSLIARTIYAEDAVSLNFLQFLKNINDQIDVLENLNYVEEDVSNFKKVMGLEVKRMINSGVASYEAQEASIPFLGSKSRVVLSDLNDQWHWRLRARIKMIEIQTRSVPVTPYETVLFAKGSLPGVPETIKLGLDLQDRHAAFRRELLKDFERKDCVTLKSMIDVCLSNMKKYKDLDRTCDLDVSFLTDSAEGLLKDQAHKLLLDLSQAPERYSFRNSFTNPSGR